MAYAAGHGYPVPVVHTSQGADMILERLHGPTMLGALLAAELTPEAGAALLAGLLHRLHTLPPRATAEPGDRLLHLDLHPDNVMLTHRGPVVIDWRNATGGTTDHPATGQKKSPRRCAERRSQPSSWAVQSCWSTVR